MAVLITDTGHWSQFTQALQSPIRVISAAFAITILTGALMLALPVASADGHPTTLSTALFTATSAVCVTGLVVVDTAQQWSSFGEVVILALIQVGGFGVMTLGSLLVLLAGRKLRMRAGHLAEAEHQGFLGMDARDIVLGVAKTTLVVEAVLAALLTARFALAYDESPGRAAYLGVFHSVSAFNNAGFALWPDSLTRYVTDPWVCLPVAAAVIAGGLGFPVMSEVWRKRAATHTWSLHLWLTAVMTTVLLAGGTLVVTAAEWSNPSTLGHLTPGQRVLAGFFHAVNTRTSGFNSVPTGDMRDQSLFATDLLMFIGGGSAGTAGGIKVTTFLVLGFVVLAELRADRRVTAGYRSIPAATQRQAVAVALLGVAAVVGGTWLLLVLTAYPLEAVFFEVTSAFGTVGLSTGITGRLPVPAQVVLMVLMFIGRVGPLTLGAALVLRPRAPSLAYPEDRPVVG